jgi:hypothetical protein
MKKLFYLSIFVILLLQFSEQRGGTEKFFEREQSKNDFENGDALNQTIYWFDYQRLDHFVVSPPRTWSQRYFV